MSELINKSFMLRDRHPELVVPLWEAERVVEERERRIAELEDKLKHSCSMCLAGYYRRVDKSGTFHRVNGEKRRCNQP